MSNSFTWSAVSLIPQGGILTNKYYGVQETLESCKQKMGYMHVPNIRMGLQMLPHHQKPLSKSSWPYMPMTTFSSPVDLEEVCLLSHPENYSANDECVSNDASEDPFAQPFKSDVLKSLLSDSERAKLIRKLSEANQQNRFLKRQLHVKEDELVSFMHKLATVEFETQSLVKLAEEMTKIGIPEDSRKINGKYLQFHLLYRLEALNEILKDQIKDVNAAQSKEVTLFWCGMAESVQVMGTFDGWNQGEYLSSEYTGSYSKFSTTLLLKPGRYEIKFLVDGEWQLSPEFQTVKEGAMKNNILIVE